VLALAIILRKRQFELALFLIPALGAVLLYGLFSHYIPRYSLPIAPVAKDVAVALSENCLRSQKGPRQRHADTCSGP
jgi:hypothetical protein